MVRLDDINFEYIQNIINMLQNVRSIVTIIINKKYESYTLAFKGVVMSDITNSQSEDYFFSTSVLDTQDTTQFSGLFVQTLGVERKVDKKQTFKLNPDAPVFVPRKQQYVSRYVTEKQKNTQQEDTNSKIISKNSYNNINTDKAVNNLILQMNNFYYVISENPSKKVSILFSIFTKNVCGLTDKHKKQLLEVMPCINYIIDTEKLNSIAIVTILYSLSKTEVCNKLDLNSNHAYEYIKYEQTVKNLIDKILIKLQKHEKYDQQEWSNIFYSLGLLVEQSADLITTENTNKLLVKFNKNIIEQERNLKLIPQHNNNILWSITKYIKYSKLDSGSIVVHSIIEYLFNQVKSNFNDFITKDINSIILSIAKLSNTSEIRKIIYKNLNILELLLQSIIKNRSLKIYHQEIGNIIYALGILINNMYFNQSFIAIIKSVYNILLSQASAMVSKFNIISSNCIMCGFIKLINNNIISYNKPNKYFIRDILFNKVIENPSIINNNDLYLCMYSITFFQEYLTKIDLIKIFRNITFFIPDASQLKIYFLAMGYLLIKIRKELNDDEKNTYLTSLEYKVITDIIRVKQKIHPYIKNFNQGIINSIYHTCCLIYEKEDLIYLKPFYKDIYQNKKNLKFKDICLDIIIKLIAESENLKLEYSMNSMLPPADACIVRSDGSILAIEIQGSGHYIDNQGDYPTSRTLLKRELYKQENIDILEVNSYEFQSYNNNKLEIMACLRYYLLLHNIKLKPDYCNNRVFSITCYS